MFRKNSWIVALLLVLSLSVFFGCIEVIEEEDTDTYTYVDLGTEFNTWGGQAYQRGWSTDGASWNDPNHTVKNLGLKLEDFKAARYLEIELNVDSTAGSVDLIWGNESNGWNQTASVAPGGAAGPLKIDLTKLINYANYKTSESQIRIIIQYNQPGQVAGLVKSAKLAIPDNVEFVPVEDITINNNEGLTGSRINLTSVLTPSDATNQKIIWSIISFDPDAVPGDSDILAITDEPGTAAYTNQKNALLNAVNFESVTVTTPDDTYIDYSVWPPATESIPDTGTSTVAKLSNVIKVNSYTNPGKVVVRATVLNGIIDEDGKEANYFKEFTITVAEKLPVKYKLIDSTTSGSDAETQEQTYDWDGAANSGENTVMVAFADGSYRATYSAGYGNCYHYIAIDLGSDTFNDYRTGGVKFTYKAIAGDANYKDNIRVMGLDAIPPSTYNPGRELGRTESTGDTAAGKEFDVKFSKVPALADKNEIYIWFVPWGDGMTFEISDIKIYKKDACGCDDDGTPDTCDSCMHCPASFCDCACNVCNPPSSVAAKYVPTADTTTDFYLDLGAHTSGSLSSKPNAKEEAGKVTFYMNANNQCIYIPLGTTLATAIYDGLEASKVVGITIDGTAAPDRNIRWTLGNTDGGNWNVTDFNSTNGSLVQGKFNTILADEVSFSKAASGTEVNVANVGRLVEAEKTIVLIIQIREGGNSAFEINSVKITIPD